jgi:cytochrome c biogenesis protein CcdA/glutaredoxin-related protein
MMKNWVAIFFCLLVFLPSGAPTQQAPTIPMYVFYATDCGNCQAILQSYVPTLKSQYPFLDIKTFELGDPLNYGALAKLEKKFNKRGQELPVIFIGDQMLSGDQEIMGKLDPLILEYQMMGGLVPSLAPLEIASAGKVSEKTFSVDMAYFYQKGCPKCDRASYLLKYINKKYPHLNVTQIDLNTDDGKRLNETLSTRFNLPSEKRLIAPSIFIGNDFLSPEEITESSVEALVEKYEKVETKSALKVEQGEMKKADDAIVERFKSFGIFAILLAGLVEGLNPCALATLVFFISYLTMIGRKRKEILIVGLGFAASSFTTHLLLGFGILRFIQHFSFFPLFTRIVYMITFALSLFLGIFSLYDYIQLKRGRPSKMTLQVPNFLKKRIHRIIRTRSNELEEDKPGQSTRFLLAALFIGFIVTLLQSTCTSQVYLPTLLFVMNVPSLKGSAYLYLIVYNLIYILPLLAIFGIVYWGVTSEQLSFFLQRRASTIKLLTAIFFFALAGVLIAGLI